MIRLNLPQYQFKIERKDDAKWYIFDEIRKKKVVLTPEEWVRQNFIQFMNKEHNVPLSVMVLEKELELNGQKKRADILLYGRDGKPFAIVECKASHIAISQDTFDQVARYNLVLKVPYLIVTNGLDHYYSLIDLEHGNFSFLKEFPAY
ncbi:MAG: type I restriction enzyme HsdR N-terminal domain-containing protein [Flavobacteriales bacterium]